PSRLATSRVRRAVLVNVRDRAPLAVVTSPDVDALALPPLGFHDAFLANSVMPALHPDLGQPRPGAGVRAPPPERRLLGSHIRPVRRPEHPGAETATATTGDRRLDV